MASLYKRKSSGRLLSPYWWIKYRDLNGKIVRESTGFKIGLGRDTANQLRAERTLQETKSTTASASERWDAWVPGYFKTRYAGSSRSLLRANAAWRMLRMFLEERQIYAPRQLTRTHCTEYLDWRQQPDKKRGKYKCCHNTALLDLVFLGTIMKGAVLRGYAPFNPSRELDIRRVKTKQKPEFTPEIIQAIDAAIDDEPEPRRTFLRNSFEIGRYHGARLIETHVNPMLDVDINGPKSRITFKVKRDRVHTVLLHPALIPLFAKLRAAGATETYQMPKSPSADWHNFFQRTGITKRLPGACFHCFRVTIASVLTREGLPERDILNYLGHATTTVSRAYVRWRPEDLSSCLAAISWDKHPTPTS